MKRIRGLVSIIRPEDCLISSVAVWIGWIAASGHLFPSHPLPLIFWSLSTFLLVGALNVLNDLGDVKIDRLIHGKRALASGRISIPLTERYLILTIMGSLALASAAAMTGGNILTFTIFLFGLGIALTYEVWLKKKGIFGNIAVATLFAFPFLLGGSVAGINTLVMILCSMAAVTGLAKEIINGVKDLEGDRGFRKTLPQTIGVNNALMIAALLLLIDITLSAAPVFLVGFSIPYVIFIGAADLILVSVMITSFRRSVIAHYLHNAGMVVSMPGFLLLSFPIPGL